MIYYNNLNYLYSYKKPTSATLTTQEYLSRSQTELDTISLHRGLDDIEPSIMIRASTSSTISKYVSYNSIHDIVYIINDSFITSRVNFIYFTILFTYIIL